MKAETLRDLWRPFRVTATVDECEDVRSFVLEPDDGQGLATHRPGQFLPISLPIGGAGGLVRSYTLSDAPGQAYRISVKREGHGGASEHDNAKMGTLLETMAPRGSFIFDSPPDRAVVMVSAGIGITPTMTARRGLPNWFVWIFQPHHDACRISVKGGGRTSRGSSDRPA